MFAEVDDEGHGPRQPAPPYILATAALATQPGTCTVGYDYQKLTCTTLRRHGLEDIHTTKWKYIHISNLCKLHTNIIRDAPIQDLADIPIN